MRTHGPSRIYLAYLLLLVTTTGLSSGEEPATDQKDVVEGESLRLTCRFDPSRVSSNTVYYWFRRNPNGSDNAALGNESLDPHYSVELDPRQGNYVLVISKANYEADHGHFQCRLREKGSGIQVFSKAYDVTVLIPPGQPVVSPGGPAREGEPFSLTCSSQGGSPDPLIQWYRGTTPLSNAQLRKGGGRNRPTASVLTLEPRMEDDGALYRCLVWNRALKDERRLEAEMRLQVHYAPRVTVGPERPMKVLSGDDVTLECKVKASPPVRSLSWLKGTQILSTAPNHTILGVTPKDSATYSCVADNGVGDATRANLDLQVLFGPEVNLVPEQELAAGSALSVKCNVAASPPPFSIQWHKEGEPYFRKTGDTLVLEHVSAEDAGRYTCSATNLQEPSGSSIQREVTGNATVYIHVTHKPGEAEVLPSTPVAIAGRPFTLSCSAKPPGWPRPEFRWWREGQEAVELSRRANYTLISAHVSQEGRYFCQPYNALGEGGFTSVYLTINEPPSITLLLRPQIIRKDGEKGFTLTCRARGKPKPQVTWYHNHEMIKESAGQHSITVTDNVEDNNAFSVQSTLVFDGSIRKGSMLTPADRGQYTCSFDNGVGKASDAHTVLHVEHSPVVRHTYNRVAFDQGETAVLLCKMQAYPEPKFSWFYNFKALEDDSRFQTNVTDLGNDVFVGALSVRDVEDQDYGDYTCRAENMIGDDEKTIIKLVKKSTPDMPGQLAAVNVNSNTVTLQWVQGFNGGYANTEYLVTFTEENQAHPRNESCRTQNPCLVTGLVSNTKYRFKVLAMNARGHSPYSEELVVDTKDMPRASSAHYDPESHVVSFHVVPSHLRLLAKIEARSSPTGDWQLVARSDNVTPNLNRIQLRPGMGYTDVRVILCLWSNESWCGDGRLASPEDEQPLPKEARPQFLKENLTTVVIIVAIVGVAFFVAIVLLVCCCWCRKGSKEKKDYEMQATNNPRPVAVAPPPYYSEGVKSMALEGSLHDDLSKHAIYATGMPNSHITGTMHPGMLYDADSSQCGGANDSHSDLWMKGGDADGSNTYKPYESGMSNGYYYPDDYQPLTDEVMNLKNRDHLHSGYYDVSGLPDPYALHHDEDKVTGPGGQQQVSFDESLESGYSTPNSRSRRVIREIIV